MNRRVAVLGANGFIGQHLVRQFADFGWSVTAATRKDTTTAGTSVRSAVSGFNRSQDFTSLIEECDCIMHAATTSTPGSSDAQPQLEGNLDTLLALLDALQRKPACRLVYLSSGGTLYGNRSDPASEDTPLLPTSYHGAGKAAAEHFIRAYAAQYGGDVCILRPSNVFGPGQRRRPEFGIIPAALSCALSGEALTIWGDGQAVRDYLYIDDLVDICRRAVAQEGVTGIRTFNASVGRGLSLTELIEQIEKVTQTSLKMTFAPARRVDVQRIVPDNHAARAALGWTPQVSLQLGLTRTWQWFQSLN